jgi:hypothetical protein
MPELPRTEDIIEIGFPGEQVVKSFVVERVVHRMVQLSANKAEVHYVPTFEGEGVVVQSKDVPLWRWEFQLHGCLYDPNAKKPVCVCAEGITKCPKHGDQPGWRDTCPLCNKAVLGYCAEGVYCTDDDCKYVA